jgi:hypothetical protein
MIPHCHVGYLTALLRAVHTCRLYHALTSAKQFVSGSPRVWTAGLYLAQIPKFGLCKLCSVEDFTCANSVYTVKSVRVDRIQAASQLKVCLIDKNGRCTYVFQAIYLRIYRTVSIATMPNYGTENCSRGHQLCSHLIVSQHFMEPESS